MNDSELLTAEQLGARLGIRPQTVRLWGQCGKIPVLKLSHKVVRFDWLNVLAVLKERAAREGAKHDA